ncbi:MAG: hypothetical protein GC206_08795 [Alphaproteobacteria bacterium]|nr:hypothetical protein [Alphaproteobacteria bacterium]
MNAPDPSATEKPNPERRSNSALLCLCIGIGLIFLAQFLGVGVAFTAALSGGSPVAVVGGLGAFIGIMFAVVAGVILSLIGGIWLAIRVIADQTGDKEERRYRNVER